MALLVDMDEVLVDFTGAALAVHGYSWADYEPKGRLVSTLGFWGLAESLGLSIDEFWQPIHEQGSNFWASLQPLPWMDQLLCAVESHEWYIVTAPSQGTASRIGKYEWMERHLPQYIDKLIITRHKHLLAKPGRILVDDSPGNLTMFCRHGGHGVLFPAYCNPAHVQRHDPVPYVISQLGLKEVNNAR